MNIPEFFVQRWESEQPAFGKVIRALPEQMGYRPHERSNCAGDLAWQLVEEQRLLSSLLDTGVINWETRPRPETVGEISAAWDVATDALRERLKTLDQAKYDGPSEFIMPGQPAWKDTVGNMLWGFLFDMVHHRGQLSTYIRPMGGKVPAIYGPSGDDNG